LTDKTKLKETLQEFISSKGPAFLEVMIDPEANVYPMVGPGMGYKEMITGDYITGRTSQDGLFEKTSKEANAF